MIKHFAHGKLLLSGEYLVLDGAKALALPTRMGQWLEAVAIDKPFLYWQAFDADGRPWMQLSISLDNLDVVAADHIPRARQLQLLLRKIRRLKPGFLRDSGYQIETRLDFNRKWGLGSSATLVALLAKWAEVDPFALFDGSMQGSGYDIACAMSGQPLFYQLDKFGREIQTTTFNPPFAEKLRFVYLKQKKRSDQAVSGYQLLPPPDFSLVDRISTISSAIQQVQKLDEFEALIDEHEQLLAQRLGVPSLKKSQFAQYPGKGKSLGAWGGDFVLLTAADGEAADRWLKQQGFDTVLTFAQLFL